MKQIINFYLYGLHQIDYIFGFRFLNCYNLRTGGALFFISALGYMLSLIIFVCVFLKKWLDIPASFFEQNFETILITVNMIFGAWWFYWISKDRFFEDFHTFDKEGGSIRWISFIIAMFIFAFGMYILYELFAYSVPKLYI